MRRVEFRWISYECLTGHVVSRGALMYRLGEEPLRVEPAEVPDRCPKCGAPVHEGLRCWDDCPAPILPGVSAFEAWGAWRSSRKEETE